MVVLLDLTWLLRWFSLKICKIKGSSWLSDQKHENHGALTPEGSWLCHSLYSWLEISEFRVKNKSKPTPNPAKAARPSFRAAPRNSAGKVTGRQCGLHTQKSPTLGRVSESSYLAEKAARRSPSTQASRHKGAVKQN